MGKKRENHERKWMGAGGTISGKKEEKGGVGQLDVNTKGGSVGSKKRRGMGFGGGQSPL